MADDNEAPAAADNVIETPQQPPELTPEQGEQLRVMLISQLVQQTQQLLAFVGVHVPEPDLTVAAKEQLDAQAGLLQNIVPLFMNPALVNEFGGFAVRFLSGEPDQSNLIIPGRPPKNPPFMVGGPKRLRPGLEVAVPVSTISALAYLLNPSLRLALLVLGVNTDFVQLKNNQQPARMPVKV